MTISIISDDDDDDQDSVAKTSTSASTSAPRDRIQAHRRSFFDPAWTKTYEWLSFDSVTGQSWMQFTIQSAFCKNYLG